MNKKQLYTINEGRIFDIYYVIIQWYIIISLIFWLIMKWLSALLQMIMNNTWNKSFKFKEFLFNNKIPINSAWLKIYSHLEFRKD